MIVVDKLTKYYGPRPAIQDVSFTVQPGEILGFLGPNGAGKTTTMRILTGYLPPTSGTASVAGFDIVRQSLQARRRIGYLPETVPLYPEMSVRSYLDYMAKVKGVPRKVRRARIDDVMEKARVAHRAGDLIGRLSKGYRQRVGLAQALVGDPEVLILDEPTVGLDPKQIIETRGLIRGLEGSHTVILSTHILPEVGATCSRVLIISDGRIVAEDTPENLDRRLRGAETIALLVRGPADDVRTRLSAVPQVLRVEARDARDGADRTSFVVECALGSDVREALARAVVSAGFGLLELRPLGLSLEEIFLRLTTSEDQNTAEEPEAVEV